MATTNPRTTPKNDDTNAEYLRKVQLSDLARQTAEAERDKTYAERDIRESERQISNNNRDAARNKMDGDQKATVAIVACAAAVLIALVVGIPSILGPQATIQKGEDTKFRVACIEEGGIIPDGYLTCLR